MHATSSRFVTTNSCYFQTHSSKACQLQTTQNRHRSHYFRNHSLGVKLAKSNDWRILSVKKFDSCKTHANTPLISTAPSLGEDDPNGNKEFAWTECFNVISIEDSISLENSTESPLPCHITLQVQSREEQDLRASTPAHPKALMAMYGAFSFSCFTEHVWRFAMPAVLSILNSSLLPVAVASFSGQLITFVAGPWVGEVMDRTPRVLAFNILSAAQIAAMVVSAGMIRYAIVSGITEGVSASAMFRQPWFLTLLLAGAVERLTGLASGVAVERDWVVQLAGHNRPIALAKANATLRRVDLVCEIVAPLLCGWLLSCCQAVKCIDAATCLMALTLPLLFFSAVSTHRLSSGVLDRRRPKILNDLDELALAGNEAESHNEIPNGLEAIAKGWKHYLCQPVLPASIAYVLLNFNAVLSPGGLMTSFLTQRGLDVSVIGMFRGACAAMGFAATFLSAPLIARMGVLKAGAAALVMQSLALSTCVLVYFLAPMNSKIALAFFLTLVVVSRLGHWTYDCVDAQIFQTAIPVNQANLVGTTEVSLSSLAELVMLAMAIAVHDVSHFGVLSMASMSSILLATFIYCKWIANPNSEQLRLFPQKDEESCLPLLQEVELQDKCQLGIILSE